MEMTPELRALIPKEMSFIPRYYNQTGTSSYGTTVTQGAVGDVVYITPTQPTKPMDNLPINNSQLSSLVTYNGWSIFRENFDGERHRLRATNDGATVNGELSSVYRDAVLWLHNSVGLTVFLWRRDSNQLSWAKLEHCDTREDVQGAIRMQAKLRMQAKARRVAQRARVKELKKQLREAQK